MGLAGLAGASEDDAQLRALLAYELLLTLRTLAQWPGEIVLTAGLDGDGTAFTIAAQILGACALTAEASADRARGAMRAGHCDFVVNTLDEALRTLKNEVRQKRPLGVVLHGDVAEALAEAAERGLVPCAFVPGPGMGAAFEAVRKLARACVELTGGDALAASGSRVYRLTPRLGCTVGAMDAALRAVVAADPAASRWVARLAVFFRNERPATRTVRLSDVQHEALSRGLDALDCRRLDKERLSNDRLPEARLP